MVADDKISSNKSSSLGNSCCLLWCKRISFFLASRNIENTFAQISVYSNFSPHAINTFRYMKDMSFHFPLPSYPLIPRVYFFMSLSITLNSFFIPFSHCVYHCYVLGSLLPFSFTTSFETTYSLSSSPASLPAVQECALKPVSI